MAKRHKSQKRHNLMHVFAVFASTVLVVSLAYFLIMQNHPSLQSPSPSSGDIVETSRVAIIEVLVSASLASHSYRVLRKHWKKQK